MTAITFGRRMCLLLTAATLGLASLVVGPGAVAAPGDLTRVGVADDESEADIGGNTPSSNRDGRYVAFFSTATNLVAGDTNGTGDVFVRDRQANTTTRVSVATDGTQGDGYSSQPSISPDGRYVVFGSGATNLVAGDTNGVIDVFVRDRQESTTTRVSVANDGTQGNDDSQYGGLLSMVGRLVAFASDATNLVAGDTNGVTDVFVRDLEAGTTTRVSVASDGAQGNDRSFEPAVSSDGRYVAFMSQGSNLVSGDSNGAPDVFVRDRHTSTTTRVSVAGGGTQGNAGSVTPSMSADGRYVAFLSLASNLVPGDTNGEGDVFVHDRSAGATTRISLADGGAQGNGNSQTPSISEDGRFVAFESDASNLVAGDTNGWYDVFVRDRREATTIRASQTRTGTQGNGTSFYPSISGDGRFVAFQSAAGNLVSGDTNAVSDVFGKELPVPRTTVVSDRFTRWVSNGWGSAPTDGAYQLTGAASSFSVNGSVGRIVSSTVASDRRAVLRGVSVRDSTATVTLTTDRMAEGTGQYVWLSTRDTSASRYRAVVLLKPDASVRLILRRLVGSTTTDLAARTVSGVTYAPGTQLTLRVETFGATPTTLRAKVWRAGTMEPSAWQLTASDAGPVTSPGGFGLGTYLSAATSALPVRHTFDNFVVTTP